MPTQLVIRESCGCQIRFSSNSDDDFLTSTRR
jgi:hypothetical protein